MPVLQDVGPIYRGEDDALVFTMTPTTDITGWTISFRVKNTLSDATALVTQAATLTTPASGIFTVSLASATTAALLPGVYAYDVWRTDSGSAAALSIGSITVRASVKVP